MILRNIHSSLLRFCSDFAINYQGMEVVNIDAHADESTVPDADFVGISGMSIDVDEHAVGVKVMFGISTLDDTNLFRMIDRMDVLFDKLLPTRTLIVYDADTGVKVGDLIVTNGTRMMPVGGSEARPLQYIMVSLLSNNMVSLSGS